MRTHRVIHIANGVFVTPMTAKATSVAKAMQCCKAKQCNVVNEKINSKMTTMNGKNYNLLQV
jgi:hypothetical protein